MSDFEIFDKDGKKIGDLREKEEGGYYDLEGAERRKREWEKEFDREKSEGLPIRWYWAWLILSFLAIVSFFLISIGAGIVMITLFFLLVGLEDYKIWRVLAFYSALIYFCIKIFIKLVNAVF